MAVERYQRQKLLGQGLMSEIWLARDLATQKYVALKLMVAVSEDDKRNQKALERFHREIQIARGLRHPSVLPILDSGTMQYEGRLVPFFVSPYMREGSFADLVKRTPPWKVWSLPQTADAIMQAAESLWYLHTCQPQIIHQDVKPANFLVESVQSPQRAVSLYLCDFGISRWRRSPSSMASELIGTFAYMAPEQVKRKLDPASDQYALAVMACYLLTGKLPLQAPTNELYAEAHLYEQPMLPSQLNPGRVNLSQIDAIFARALAKHPERRYPTIIAFAQALQQACIEFSETRATAKTERQDLTYADMFPTQEKRARTRSSTLLAEPDFPRVIDMPEIDDHRILDEPLPVKPLKVALSPRTNDVTDLPLLPLQEAARYTLPARPKMLAWSPDSSMLVSVLYGYGPIITYRDGRSQDVRVPDASHTSCLAWSPDGRFLALSTAGEIRFWDTIQQIALPLVLSWNVRNIDGLDWSASGRLAVWGESQIRLYALSAHHLTAPQLLPSQTLPTGLMRCVNLGVLRWSPDGMCLVAGASNGEVRCWEFGHQAAAWQVVGPGQKVNSLSWSPDGSLLAVAFRDHRVVGWDIPHRSNVFLWEKLPVMPRMVSVSSERQIVIASAEKYLLFGNPNQAAPSTVFPGQLLVGWSPTRRELATLSEQNETSLVVWQA